MRNNLLSNYVLTQSRTQQRGKLLYANNFSVGTAVSDSIPQYNRAGNNWYQRTGGFDIPITNEKLSVDVANRFYINLLDVEESDLRIEWDYTLGDWNSAFGISTIWFRTQDDLNTYETGMQYVPSTGITTIRYLRKVNNVNQPDLVNFSFSGDNPGDTWHFTLIVNGDRVSLRRNDGIGFVYSEDMLFGDSTIIGIENYVAAGTITFPDTIDNFQVWKI